MSIVEGMRVLAESLLGSTLTPVVAAPVVAALAVAVPVPAKLVPAILAVAPRSNAAQWAAVLAAPMNSSGITTPRRIAAFLGQVAHESTGLSVLTENLNYGAPGLMATFGSHFEDASEAATYARQPERIANRVYADRMGNGNEASGDGWRFRGAGLIQLTGRANHTKLGASVGKTAEQCADWARTPEGAAAGACWFWSINGLNIPAEAWNLYAVTQRINGGQNGAEQRTALCNAALKVFS